MATPKGFTESELEALSPEEREAIEEYEVDDDAATETNDDTDTDAVEGSDADNTTDEDKAAAAIAAAEAAAAESAAGTTTDADGTAATTETAADADATAEKPAADAAVDDTEEDSVYMPTMKVNGNLETLQADLKKITTDKAELNKKFQDGDISTDEYIQGNDELTDKALDIKSHITKEETAIDFNKNQEAGRWQHDQDQFARTTDGKVIFDNPMLLAAFDNKVRELGAVEANKDKPGSFFLKTAAAEVKKFMGGAFAPAKTEPEPKPAATTTTAKPAVRKPDLETVPITLGGLPAAATDDQAGVDEFAFLDKLEGSQLEDELAKMERSDPNKYDRYLKAA